MPAVLAPDPAPPNVEGWVQWIMSRMRLGVDGWPRGSSAVVAAATGLSVDTIERYAAEASRRVRAPVDQEQVRQYLAAVLFTGAENMVRLTAPHMRPTMRGKMVLCPGDPVAGSSLASLARASAEVLGLGSEAPKPPGERPVVNIIYAPSQGDATAADPAEPPAEPGAPGTPAGK